MALYGTFSIQECILNHEHGVEGWFEYTQSEINTQMKSHVCNHNGNSRLFTLKEEIKEKR